jgi:hypothetical protein
MSLMEAVREKYKCAHVGADKTDKSPSVSSVSPQRGQSETVDGPSVGSVSFYLKEFAAALQTGRLVICRKCSHFAARPSRQPDGWCDLHGETWAAVPFDCPEHEGIVHD